SPSRRSSAGLERVPCRTPPAWCEPGTVDRTCVRCQRPARLLQYAAPVPYRCAHCGNKTRFDVVATVRSRSFHHFTLGGEVQREDEEVLAREVESVTCRWCERSDGIEEFSLD